MRSHFKQFFMCFLLGTACEASRKWDPGDIWEGGQINDSGDFFEAGPEAVPEYCNYIYLLEHRTTANSHRSYLWKFKPETSTLSQLGEVQCLSETYLIAMTADQEGFMYILGNSEQIYKLDPQNMSCVDTGMNGNDSSRALRSRSLAFMREDGNSPDILYLGTFYDYTGYDNDLGVLTTIDEEGMRIMGEMTDLYGIEASTEVAGTSDGRLFAQSSGPNSRFLELDPYTGSILQSWQLGIDSGGGFTFSLWEGEVWLFPSTIDNTTELNRFNMNDGSIEYLTTFDHVFVGAASPTCADPDAGG